MKSSTAFVPLNEAKKWPRMIRLPRENVRTPAAPDKPVSAERVRALADFDRLSPGFDRLSPGGLVSLKMQARAVPVSAAAMAPQYWP